MIPAWKFEVKLGRGSQNNKYTLIKTIQYACWPCCLLLNSEPAVARAGLFQQFLIGAIKPSLLLEACIIHAVLDWLRFSGALWFQSLHHMFRVRLSPALLSGNPYEALLYLFLTLELLKIRYQTYASWINLLTASVWNLTLHSCSISVRMSLHSLLIVRGHSSSTCLSHR